MNIFEGLVPKLKTLQISENPIVYPNRKILVEGTKAIKHYLKDQYVKLYPVPSVTESEANMKSEDDLILSDEDPKFENEKLISSVDDSSSTNDVNKMVSSNTSKSSKTSTKTKSSKSRSSSSKIRPKQLLQENLKNRLSDPHLDPSITIQTLENQISPTKKLDKSLLKIVHKISKSGSRISLKSYFNRIGIRNSKTKIDDKNLKMGWLNQLRILLNDQERILQQERYEMNTFRSINFLSK